MRSYYSKNLKEFLHDDTDNIFKTLVEASGPVVTQEQKEAWMGEIQILKEEMHALGLGQIFLEFTIPRMGKRADAILVLSGMVFVIEFKIGEKEYRKADIEQCVDYALDLKNFHVGSHNVPIVPVLVATDAPNRKNEYRHDKDGIFQPMMACKRGLGITIAEIANAYPSSAIDAVQWEKSGYRPTPTIIEAARALYAKHNVSEITRSEAGAENLTKTADIIEKAIDESKKHGQKSICFVTGVPGAGKTLAGLNLASRRQDSAKGEHAVFLSGNGPLIDVLQEALARDRIKNYKQARKQNPNTPKITKADALRQTNVFIQSVRNFLTEAIKDKSIQHERIVIFDEAQRAWDKDATDKFMKEKKADVSHMSQPEFLISVMDRHSDWAVIVCLVGGGQEINHNEAGLPEWFSAIRNRYPEWNVYLPDEITDDEYVQGSNVKDMLDGVNNLHHHPELHLATSIRSFRSEHVSGFVKALLDLDSNKAEKILHTIDKYPIVLTRDFGLAKKWLRDQPRGSERFGIVAAAKSYRLKPHGIYVELAINAAHWFLNPAEDPRSSCSLEYAATEFKIQGLELDWACVAWDADLRYVGAGWQYREFRGDKWTKIGKDYKMRYLKNAYRVLLTRARQGMVIFVPEGDSEDGTRDREFYDGTYCYLKEMGIKELTVD